MKTTWFKVLDGRLGYKPDPDKWEQNTAMLEKHKYYIANVQSNPKLYTPLERVRVVELLEWLEEHKPREAEDPHDYLEGLQEWVESHEEIESTCVDGDYEQWAGMGIPWITKTYQVGDRLFKVSTYPDWDNYSSDCTIYMNDIPVSIMEG